MKKLLSLILPAVMLYVTPLCALEKTLSIWTSNENVKKAILSMAAQFEKEYQTKVEVNVLNKDLTTQFKTAALTSKGPDILCWAHDVIGELAESGLIEPITLPPSLKNQFLPVALNAFTYNGKLFGYPYDLEAVALIYNKALLPNVPTSLEALAKLAKEINNNGKNQYGFLYDLNNFFFSFPILASNGGYIFKDRSGSLDVTDIGLDNPGTLAGAKFISYLVKEGIIPPSTDRSIAFDKMKAGSLAATIDGPWSLSDMRKSNIKYGIAPIPSLNGMVARPFVGSHGFIVRRSSANRELAKEFIENYLVSFEGIVSLYKNDPRGPSRSDAIAQLSKDDPDLLNFMKSAENGIPMPNVPQMGAVWGSMGSALNLIVSGQSTPEEALKVARQQIYSAVAKAQ